MEVAVGFMVCLPAKCVKCTIIFERQELSIIFTVHAPVWLPGNCGRGRWYRHPFCVNVVGILCSFAHIARTVGVFHQFDGDGSGTQPLHPSSRLLKVVAVLVASPSPAIPHVIYRWEAVPRLAPFVPAIVPAGPALAVDAAAVAPFASTPPMQVLIAASAVRCEDCVTRAESIVADAEVAVLPGACQRIRAPVGREQALNLLGLAASPRLGIAAWAHFRATAGGVIVWWSAPSVVGPKRLDVCWRQHRIRGQLRVEGLSLQP